MLSVVNRLARDIAFRVLELVEKGGFASDLLRHESENLSPRDAGLAETIVMGSLRHQAQLDYLIENYSGRKQKLDPEVRIALRMGIYQLRYLDRIPAHAAVAEAVELVKRARKRSAAPFVNAMLRKVNREPVAWPDLATELSIPPWMLDRWQRQYGGETGRKNRTRGARRAGRHPSTRKPGGEQDIGAQSIVPLLAIEPGMTVLDLCAAPGNKTAQAHRRRGSRHRVRSFPCRRLAGVPGRPRGAGCHWAAAVRREIRPDSDRRAVLRHRNAGAESGDQVAPEARRSGSISEHRSGKCSRARIEFLKPGGRLVYATCSLEREENEEVVEGHAAEIHRRLPGRDPGDGFFAAVIA